MSKLIAPFILNIAVGVAAHSPEHNTLSSRHYSQGKDELDLIAQMGILMCPLVTRAPVLQQSRMRRIRLTA
jgi:hypothetical protein